MEYIQLTLPELELEEQQIRENLGGIVKNFVRTGWHLARIDKSGAYKLKGFNSISEYARTTFGMAPDGTSRFMRVYERYSVPGDTPELREEYRDFNFSQLTEMLQLPESDYAMIRAETPREDLRELKKFNKQSENNPDKLLNWQQEPDDILREAVKEFFRERKKDLNEIYEKYGIGPYTEDEIKKMSRFLYHEKKKRFKNDMVFMMLYPDQVFIKNSDGELHDITWIEFFGIMGAVFDSKAAGSDTWKNYFEPVSDRMVPEEQIPGQDNIMNHPEYLPGKLHGRKFEHCIYSPEENCISEDCGFCEKKRLLDRQKVREQAEKQSGHCLYKTDYPCTLTAEQKVTPGNGEDCNEKCCWNCTKHEGCKYQCNVSANRPDSEIQTSHKNPISKELRKSAQTDTEVLQEITEPEKIRREEIQEESSDLEVVKELKAEIAPAQMKAWPEDLSDIPVPSLMAIEGYLEEEEQKLKDYVGCDVLPERIFFQQQLKVAGLRLFQNLVKDILEIEEEESIQPEFPKLKNNEERKTWLRNYKVWPLRHVDSYTGAKYYEYRFDNGAVLVAEVWEQSGDKYMPEHEVSYLHLIGGPEPPKAQYGWKWTRHESFNRYPDNETELVEFLKEIQKNG